MLLMSFAAGRCRPLIPLHCRNGCQLNAESVDVSARKRRRCASLAATSWINATSSENSVGGLLRTCCMRKRTQASEDARPFRTRLPPAPIPENGGFRSAFGGRPFLGSSLGTPACLSCKGAQNTDRRPVIMRRALLLLLLAPRPNLCAHPF